MNDRERAAGMSTVDLGEWSEPLPDADDLISSDLAAAAEGLGCLVVIAVSLLMMFT